MEHICYENQCLTLFPTKTIYFSKKNVFFSSWDFILKQWRRGQHWRKLKVRFRFTETPFLPNHRTLPKPCFCRTSKPKPKYYPLWTPPTWNKIRQNSTQTIIYDHLIHHLVNWIFCTHLSFLCECRTKVVLPSSKWWPSSALFCTLLQFYDVPLWRGARWADSERARRSRTRSS